MKQVIFSGEFKTLSIISIGNTCKLWVRCFLKFDNTMGSRDFREYNKNCVH